MSSARLPSFRRQQLLLEFAILKRQCPDGIYLAPCASTASTWSGVLFVRSGPYASALVRFEVIFPPTYPDAAPLIICSTELFHPLLTPLTTYSLAGGALDSHAAISASSVTRSTPGSFSLRHGFPAWYAPPIDSKLGTLSTVGSDVSEGPDVTGDRSGHDHNHSNPLEQMPKVLLALKYFKLAFEDFDFLDSLPLEAAVNANAWHAWRAHRGLPKVVSRSVSPASMESSRTPSSTGKQPADWNWDGVWQSRVEDGIEESVSDAALYSSQARRAASIADGIRFIKIDHDKLQEVQDSMLEAFGIEPSSLRFWAE